MTATVRTTPHVCEACGRPVVLRKGVWVGRWEHATVEADETAVEHRVVAMRARPPVVVKPVRRRRPPEPKPRPGRVETVPQRSSVEWPTGPIERRPFDPERVRAAGVSAALWL